MSKTDETYFDRIFNRLKNNKLFAWTMILGIISGTCWAVLPKSLKDRINTQIENFEFTNTSTQKKNLLQQVKSYYVAVMQQRINSSDFFAPQVNQFISVTNPTNQQLQSLFSQSYLEFITPQITVHDSTFTVAEGANNEQITDYWINFQCFRKSKLRYQTCNVHVEMLLDKAGKITSYKELEVKDLAYFNKETHFTGNVGKLVAEFNLTVDYQIKQVSGTYYYPSRKSVVYSLTGTVENEEMLLTEYTNGEKSAVCKLTTSDNYCYTGTMQNTNGKVFAMKICREFSSPAALRTQTASAAY
ncbi:MAG: hypothetical protein IM638_12910 [Bacteroidetes bacterium]|nr:hypothetical protein [Bacteroidota bacterium]